ncbi:hypothetical protein JOY44_16155 [Phormidium sp. CLA17]|nr:hypothetical protein [Leptolyngbya sp. Cla-17]
MSQKTSSWLKPTVAAACLLSSLAAMPMLNATATQAEARSLIPTLNGQKSGSTCLQTQVETPVLQAQTRQFKVNDSSSLPKAIRQKVLAIASKELRIPVNQLKITAERSRFWDGCLGVASPKAMCPMIGIPGWQVIVAGPQEYWVYHLNKTATLIKRNPTTSAKGSVVPTFWQADSTMVAAKPGEIIFQSSTTGGIAGQAYKTLLQKDGQVVRIDLRQQPPTPTLIRRLSPPQVQEFVRFLQQNEFEDFLDFNYSPTAGADYFAIALMTPRGNGIQYVDIVQDQTPLKLQQIIQAWNRITKVN